MMKITPCNEPGDYATGYLCGYTKSEIDKIIGFEPNCKDDPLKVRYSWGFTVEINGEAVRCGIWDYKGSHREKKWTTFGPAAVFAKLFPFKGK
jgi:hypothetical protein